VAHSGGGSEIDIDLIRDVLHIMPDYINLSNPAYLCDRMKDLGKYGDTGDRHFSLLAKAFGRFARKDETGLSIAESALTGGNLFNTFAKGGFWARLPVFIKNNVRSFAKDLTAEDLRIIRTAATPALPNELSCIAMDDLFRCPDLRDVYLHYIEEEVDKVVEPVPSPVAKILVGRSGAEPEPETYVQTSDSYDDRAGHDSDDEDGQTAESEELGDGGEAGVQETEDIAAGDDDGNEDGDETTPPDFGSLPTDRSRIAIVVTGSGNMTRCRVETSGRNRLDSNVSRLANLFAKWAELHPDKLFLKDGQPPFETQDGMLNELLSIASSSEKLTKKDMTEFAKRGIIYWDSAYLPVRALCRKNGRRWSCKRVATPT